jgi:chromosome partitioning protein
VRTIVVASRKGGAGKTTVTGHLAVEAERAADTPVCADVGAAGLAATLASLEQTGVKLVMIDTPPFATTEVAAILGEANLVIVPVVPSPHDLRAIGETIELVEAQGKPMVFVVSNASTNGKLTLQAVTALSQHGTVAPTVIHTRQDYRSAMIKGRTAGEVFPKSKSASEISELWAYLEGRLKKGTA